MMAIRLRNPSSTKAQRNCRALSMISIIAAPRPLGGERGSPPDVAVTDCLLAFRFTVERVDSAGLRHLAMGKQPEDEAEREQPDEAVGAEVLDQRNDVCRHRRNEGNICADQKPADDPEGDEHQAKLGQSADPALYSADEVHVRFSPVCCERLRTLRHVIGRFCRTTISGTIPRIRHKIKCLPPAWASAAYDARRWRGNLSTRRTG